MVIDRPAVGPRLREPRPCRDETFDSSRPTWAESGHLGSSSPAKQGLGLMSVFSSFAIVSTPCGPRLHVARPP